MMFAFKVVASVPLVSGICGCLLALLLGSETPAQQKAIADAYDRRDREYAEALAAMGSVPKGDRQ